VFRERFDAESPTAVDALNHADYDGVEGVWLALSEWHTLRERSDRLEAVRRDRMSESAAGDNTV
jgi:hypothetical protein